MRLVWYLYLLYICIKQLGINLLLLKLNNMDYVLITNRQELTEAREDGYTRLVSLNGVVGYYACVDDKAVIEELTGSDYDSDSDLYLSFGINETLGNEELQF